MARHLGYYFSSLGLPLLKWSRNGDPQFNTYEHVDRREGQKQLKELLHRATHLWILTKDSAIKEVSEYCSEMRGSQLCQFHCSGSLYFSKVFGAHPLMTFGSQLYPLTSYSKIPFVLDPKTPDLNQIVPLFQNPVVRLDPQNKPLYHALCVASGNFSVLLWQMAKVEFSRLGIEWEYLRPYLEQTCFNVSHSVDEALTGPLARRDKETIESNLSALRGRDLGLVYSQFWKIFEDKLNPIQQEMPKPEGDSLVCN
ncbi:MAG: DUF2520 domain-containing protein [Bdellovibrionales bacterium]|nr:DUF2520 domain-containing protein [Bdellovibrionales bacterium]